MFTIIFIIINIIITWDNGELYYPMLQREENRRLRETSLATTEGTSIQDMHEWVKVMQSPSVSGPGF